MSDGFLLFLLYPFQNLPVLAGNCGRLPSAAFVHSHLEMSGSLFKLTNDTSFLNDILFSLFQKTSFHGISAYVYFAI